MIPYYTEYVKNTIQPLIHLTHGLFLIIARNSFLDHRRDISYNINHVIERQYWD